MWQYQGQQRPSFALTPGEGEESVWDYPRPPACVEDSRLVEIKMGEIQLASTTNAVRVLETASPPTVYIPPQDINFELLEKSDSNASFCEWKGRATYWTFVYGERRFENLGWSYENPSDAFEAIQGYLSFYPAQIQCWLGGERVKPQPGGFYGGWVTSEIIGPYKGEPGTAGW